MRITRRQLRRLIKEELSRALLKEDRMPKSPPTMPSGGPVLRMGGSEVRTDSSFTDEHLDQIRRFLVEMKKMIASAGRYEGGGQFWMDGKDLSMVSRPHEGGLVFEHPGDRMQKAAKRLWKDLELPRNGKLVIIYSPGPR
jgi:hypothetical protein